MRWLRELLQPAERCARLGHALQVDRRLFIRLPTEMFSRFVAERVTEERQRCRRCEHVTEWAEVRVSSLTGISMPTPMFDQLQREGRVNA